MNFPVMVFMVGMVQLFTVFYEFKYPRTVSGFNIKLSRSVQLSLGLCSLALIEFFLAGTFYFSYLLTILLAFLSLSFVGHILRRKYLTWQSNKKGISLNTVDALFYLNLKVRQFCSSDQVSNTFFYKNDGLIVFFGEPETSFEAMTYGDLLTFKQSLVQPVMGHVKFGGFLVIKDKDDYISLSSSEFEMLNVPVTDINQDHLTLIKMARI